MKRRQERLIAWADIPGSEENEERMNQVLEVLESLTPLLEYQPPGGFYLDFSGVQRLWGHPREALEQVKTQLEQLGFPGTFGLGPNKFLARAAASLIFPGETFWLLEQGKDSFLAALPVELWPGLGIARASQMQTLGISRVADLLRVSPYWVRMVFKKRADLLLQQACGRDPRPVVRRLPRSGGEMLGCGFLFPPRRKEEKFERLRPVLEGLRARYGKKSAPRPADIQIPRGRRRDSPPMLS